MTRFILLITGIALLAVFPILILLIGIFLLGFHCCCGNLGKLRQIFDPAKRTEPAKTKEKKDEVEYPPYDMQKEAKEYVNKKFKPDYQEDEEWQQMSKDINKVVEENTRKAQIEEENELAGVETPSKPPTKAPKTPRPIDRPHKTVQDPPHEMSDAEIMDAMHELNN